ncbi:MAG: cell surface protein SprA, partial [Bacteroidia bacterium]|nr:cell surface protein SprA [Bacteroidia bacterium]
FADGTPNDGTGGELYFNLGSMSEDVLRDGHKSFENGLPAQTNNYTTGNSSWGRYPIEQSIVNAFDNDPASRTAQDVGLDGYDDAGERTYFDVEYLQQVSANFPTALPIALADPSNDNYQYFLNPDFSTVNAPPLDRYKYYNGHQGNSPANGTINGVQSTATSIPDAEDINRDNNMDVGENYFQYRVDIKQGSMVVGQNYITDMIESPVRFANNTTGTVKWYQFKIPVKSPEQVIGEVDIQNIRFIRMFMKQFETPIICRFAKLEFLRGEWRRYNFSLLQPGEYSPTPEVPGGTQFDIASVSIEENGSRQPVPYVLPPGIEKERDISTTQLSTLNEQSLVLRVCELPDGDARAAYKNTQVDLRAYKKLKMFIHAESAGVSDNLQNGDLRAFVRLGSDFNENYYEYEIPLVITPWNSTAREEVWPAANDMEIDMEKLVDAKLLRNNALQSNSTVTLLTPYRVVDGDRTIIVKGTPNLSSVRSIMIGVRNPKDPNGDGPKICAEVWVNEMRLSDFDNDGGWASTARITTKLADLGTMTVTGIRSTAGWGSIEQKVSERDKENKSAYDIATTLEMGKFLPEKSGIKVPMYFGYGESFINPDYNPLDPDVKLSKALDATPNTETRDSIQKQVQDYTQRKSLNFTNVRKIKTGAGAGKSRIYDVENLNFGYAYTENYQRNYNIEYSLAKTHQGTIGYNYNSSAKPIMPFDKSKALSGKGLKLIKDFNFNPLPSGLNFRATLDRTYAETQLRNNSGLPFRLDPTFIKTYTMQRYYGLIWDLTKSVKMDFNADASANIDEPVGRLDTREERDSVKENLAKLGRLTRYHHGANITYNVPLNKIPMLDWVSGNIRYGSNYSWQASPLYRDTLDDLIKENPWGNTIQNSMTMQYNANVTFTTLYNKIPYLKKINSVAPARGREAARPVKVKSPKDSLSTQNDTMKVKKPSAFAPVVKEFVKLLMMFKTASFSYSETDGTMLPGFRGTPDLLGQDWNFNGNNKGAPGWGFLFGSQTDPRPEAVKYNWLTEDTTLNSFFTTTHQENFTARINAEPIKSLKIEISGNRNFSLSHSEYYRYGTDGVFRSYSPTETGNFSISYLTWNTHFVKDAQDYSNDNFETFKNNLVKESSLLAIENPNSPGTVDTSGYQAGYGRSQQEVLTYAFLAAYSGNEPSKKLSERFPKIPRPNWRITYDGLSRVKAFQKILQSFSLSHGYRSTYSINSFSQNLLYEEINSGPSNRDTAGNFIPQYSIQQITLAEQLAPLIGIDITWKNSLQTRFEIKRDRTLTLAYSNIQVTEVRGVEYILGLGYKIKRVTFPFSIGRGKKPSNDLSLRADFSLRRNTTILRKLVENTNQPSSGSQTMGVKISADYPITDRFNIRAFYDWDANDPFVSSSYPISNTNAGISIRFTLAQ